MNLWFWVILVAVLAYVTKLVGHLVPRKLLESERALRVAGCLTVGLLASLVVTNAFVSGSSVVLDARIGALFAAVVALLLRAPFLVVVLAGAAAAAGLRLLGWG